MMLVAARNGAHKMLPDQHVGFHKTKTPAQTCSNYFSTIVIFGLLLIIAQQTKAQQSGGLIGTAHLDQDCSRSVPKSVGDCLKNNASGSVRAVKSVYDASYKKAGDFCRQKRQLSGESDELCYAWRFKYIDEQTMQGQEVRVLDESLDERIANSIYTVISTRIVNMDFFDVASGYDELDKENLNSVTSKLKNDELCGQHLNQMIEILANLESKLVSKRQNASLSLGLEDKHIRLARVLDSFGHYDSGLMSGRTHSLGAYSQCVSSNLLLASQDQEDDIEVGTRFCWARLSLNKHLNAQLRDRKPSPFEAREKVFMLGTCLPQSCHTTSFRPQAAASGEQTRKNLQLAQTLINTQFKLPRSLFIDESLDISSIYCLVDQHTDYGMPLTGKLVIGFIVAWLLLVCYSTYYQEFRQRPSMKKSDDNAVVEAANLVDNNKWMQAIVDCLNLKKSWQDFTEEPYVGKHKTSLIDEQQTDVARNRPQLDVLNPIKVFGGGYVVLGHSLIIQTATAMDSLRSYNVLENDPTVLSMIVGTVIVDTFFVITGILMAYIALQKSVKNGKIKIRNVINAEQNLVANGQCSKKSLNGDVHHEHQVNAIDKPAEKSSQTSKFFKAWAQFIIQRHFRILPLFFLVYAFKKSVLIYVFGFGQPLWDNGFNKDTLFGACKQESWWTPFILMTSFLPLSKQCLPQSWSISSDLFFSIVVTPIVLIMIKKPRLGVALAIMTGLISYGWTLHEYNTMPLHMATPLSFLRAHGFAFMFGDLHYLYTHPHLRLTSILVGLIIGYALHRYQQSEKPSWPYWIRNFATKSSFLSIVLLFLAISTIPQLKPLMVPYEREIFTHLFTTGRIIWALCNGILFLRMSTDWKNTFLMKQFASRFWNKLAKLNLAILLIHMDILMFQMGNTGSLNYFSRQGIFTLYGSTYLLCVPAALVLHIMFENPIDKLLKRHVLPKMFSATHNA